MESLRESLQRLSPSFNPFLDDGVLRVGGRLQHATIPRECKHPVILPPNDHVTSLLIDYHHRFNGHAGTAHVLASIRKSVWILRGQAAVRKTLRECRVCRLHRAKAGEQFMAPLPDPRVNPGGRPFEHVMLDYFGPMRTRTYW